MAKILFLWLPCFIINFWQHLGPSPHKSSHKVTMFSLSGHYTPWPFAFSSVKALARQCLWFYHIQRYWKGRWFPNSILWDLHISSHCPLNSCSVSWHQHSFLPLNLRRKWLFTDKHKWSYFGPFIGYYIILSRKYYNYIYNSKYKCREGILSHFILNVNNIRLKYIILHGNGNNRNICY